MEHDLYALGILGVMGLFVLYLTLRLRWVSASRRWRLARSKRRAARGERDAEPLLASLGYRVVERQVSATLTYRVDGEPTDVGVRADLIVSRRGRSYLCEVKTGENAPNPTQRATRRQLLEYGHAFDVDGVLLVDPERGLVREIGLPRREVSARVWPSLLVGAAIGSAAVWAWLTL